jgi:hypothetical protein
MRDAPMALRPPLEGIGVFGNCRYALKRFRLDLEREDLPRDLTTSSQTFALWDWETLRGLGRDPRLLVRRVVCGMLSWMSRRV